MSFCKLGGRVLQARPLPWKSYVEISRILSSWRVTSLRNSSLSGITRRSLHQTTCKLQQEIKNQNVSGASSSVDFLSSYKHSFHFPGATRQISELAHLDPTSGEEVVLHGYLGSRSDLSKKLSFVPLLSKELDYSVQIISSAKQPNGGEKSFHAKIKDVEAYSPVAIKGRLKARAPTKSDLGDVEKIKNLEIELIDVYPLNEFPKDIILTEETKFPAEQRHLQLRTEKSIRDALAFRSRTAAICRDELGSKQGFLEIETPLLFKSTPEGAREFLVPTRRKGFAYALPQSPQQYKQILMASGIPRYYQIAKCFRDEDLRADRQPEFTQLDLEMAFATGEDVMGCIEQLLRRLWVDLLGDTNVPEKFPRMPYHEAMSKYGSDKPDIRLGMEISSVGHLLPVDLISKITPLTLPTVEVMKFHVSDDPRDTREFVTSFLDGPGAATFNENPDGAPGIFVVDSRKPLSGLSPFGFEAAEYMEEELQLEHGDLVVLQARKNAPHSGGSTALGNLRLALHKAAVAQGLVPAATGFEFLWIVDFPLFSPTNESEPGQGGTAGLASTHHPFTSPKNAEDVDLLVSDPMRVTADHYDIVVNGVELGGGSRRIHDARVQEYILKEVLKVPSARLSSFSHLLDVLRAGCPPHAGIALGFDRLIAVLLGRDSVRDVIAFPKSGKGEDLLVKSPGQIREGELETYHLEFSE
ncbi:putative aspartyl-tRNA synthetase [Xylona heveae TC161]|uniref:Putative aspartyl-tRNA synthetase n=1 Tax=Xylona heveae (strain CBS 132557 / TC161) TaxID=1328760 RepID=A0A165JGL5_XYLHT|nr:putative aspartyl-tRNA synthetase [Xylona heveae TC161]KZF26210.1 putative aspartyl-tRNA synthetase [Xylona heveae TC161]